MSTPIKIYSPVLVDLATISAASSALRKEAINGENTLNFSIRVKDPASDYINKINVIGLGSDYFDIAWYKKEQQSDGALMISVECEQVSYRLNHADYAVTYFNMTDTPTNILAAILADTGFTVGTVDFTDPVTFNPTLTGATAGQQMSRRSVLMQFVDQLGGEVEFSAFSVSIKTARGSATPKTLTVGTDVAVISEAADKRALDESGDPAMTYTVGIYKGTAVDLGDVVTLTYSALGISTSLRIMSKAYDPYNPNNVTIEVGNYTKTIESTIYGLQTQKASTVYVDALQEAATNLNKLVTHSLGYYQTDVIDPTTGAKTTYLHDAATLEASMVIYVFTESGLAWTDQGWNGGSPTWQYGITADGNAVLKVLTALGINADWINAGTINAAQVAIGADTTYEEGYDPSEALLASSVTVIDATTKLFKNITGVSTSGNPTTGYLIIETPIEYSYMCRISVRGYNFRTGLSNFDLDLSFYAYQSPYDFYNSTYTSKGNFPITSVKVARKDTTKVVIIIATDTTAWYYPKITVESALIGHSNPPDSYKDGWTVFFGTDLSSYTKLTTVTGLDIQSTASTALTNAATAQSAANAAQADATTSLGKLSDIASDAKITPVEKLEAWQRWAGIFVEGVSALDDLVVNGDFSSGTTGWYTYRCTASVVDGIANVVNNYEGSAGQFYRGFNVVLGHTYLIKAKVKSDTSQLRLNFSDNVSPYTSYGSVYHSGSSSYETLYFLGTVSATVGGVGRVSMIDNRTTGFTTNYLDDVVAIDLTAEFASWTSPTAAEAYNLLALFPNSFFSGSYTGSIPTKAAEFSVSATAYNTAFTNLFNYLYQTLSAFESMTATTSLTRADWDGYWTAYYNARTDLLNAIAAKTKSDLDTLSGSLGDLAYLDLVEDAKLGTTVIVGGYIKSSLLTATNIVTGKMQSVDGTTYFDLNNNLIYENASQAVTELIDAIDAVAGSLNTSTGAEEASSYYGRTGYFAIQPSTNVTTAGTLYTCYKFFYTAAKAFISYSSSASVTAPATAGYVRLRFYNSGSLFSSWEASLNGTLAITVPVKLSISPSTGLELKKGDDVIMGVLGGASLYSGDKLILKRELPVNSTDLTRRQKRTGLIFDESFDPSSATKPTACIQVLDVENILSPGTQYPYMYLWAVGGKITLACDYGIDLNDDVDITGNLDVTSNVRAAGKSTSWGVTDGINTGALNAIMGTATGATWLLSGTSDGTFKYGIQGYDGGTALRFYAGSGYISYDGSANGAIWHGGNLAKSEFPALVGKASKTWDPASLSAGTSTSTTVTVTGAAVGDQVLVSHSGTLAASQVLCAKVTSSNTVTIYLYNPTSGAVDTGSQTWYVQVLDT